MGRRIFRRLVMLFSLCGSAGVMAVGFGELRGQPVLGERLVLGVELLGAAKPIPDASCFRIVPPAGGSDLPWLKKAVFGIRPGNPLLVEIRSDTPLREPIIQLAVELGCGYDISRTYVLLASPALEKPRADDRPAATLPQPAAPAAIERQAMAAIPPVVRPSRAASPKMTLPRPATIQADRLMLSGGGGAQDISLRLATEFAVRDQPVKEVQRDILRLEFRMLMAMNEQAATQLAAAEKLRNMESTLLELRRQAATFAQRIEKGEAASPAMPPPAAPMAPKVEAAGPAAGGLTEWSLYGALFGALLGLGGWLAWQNYRDGRRRRDEGDLRVTDAPKVMATPTAVAGLDLPLERALDTPARIDFELDGGGGAVGVSVAEVAEVAATAPVLETPVPEMHVEVNPVMELADIMLSFGRVKGAAQTLQEYIDNNPQDALQPWIRLMEVYRMAGMREEFEKVARNLNRHFNVEVLAWEDVQAERSAPAAADLAAQVRPHSLEEMPRLMAKVVELWNAGDVVGYLYQLLRDNRGGERVGFAMPVVDDILFLIELKETANRME